MESRETPVAALLTEEAVRAAGHEVWQRTSGYPSTAQTDNARTALAAALRYHATEGREALVEVVRLSLAPGTGVLFKAEAEAVVTALVGEAKP